MALEQAGVDLQAKDFQEYLRKLDAIEKKQRDVFDQQFKGTGKSYDQITRAAREYERQMSKASSSQEIFGKTLGALGLAVGARELFQFGKEAVQLANESARASGQLAAAIQSTGGAAGLSSRELQNLAAELQNTTNFEDDATVASEALLLTFTNIGRSVFPDAVRLTQDMATALGQDLSSAALTVGKALNDPVEGISALRRSGVQFSDEQERQIKHFVETNQLAQAQGVILAELARQFGGSAEAARAADGGIVALSNSYGSLKEQFGFLIKDLSEVSGATEATTGTFDALTRAFRGFRAEIGKGDTSDAIAGLEGEISSLQAASGEFAAGGGRSLVTQALDLFRGDTGVENVTRLDEEIAKLQQELSGLETQAAAEDAEELAKAQKNAANSTSDLNGALATNDELLKGLQGALKQAENLQLSFARTAEDATRNLERQQAKLGKTQGKDREKLLIKQQKDLDKFEKERVKTLEENEQNRIKSIAKAEADIAKAEQEANRQRIDAQKQLQQRLAQQAEQFRLSQTQSERRFQLDERRLRAEGDILGLQQLRENHSIEQLEAQENFDLQQKQTKEGEQAQSETRVQEQQARLEELKANLDQERKDLEISLEEQRAQMLAGFDEQLLEQETAQAEQRAALLETFAEQEEDRRINQERQLEDLGRSLAEQKDLTAEGALAIVEELEKVFGVEGVADAVFGGFTDRTESKFNDLFGNISKIVEESTKEIERIPAPKTPTARAATELLGLPSFQEGGIVPGPRGSPQIIRAEGGETVLPTHRMSVPIIPSQSLNVLISGGFDIAGGEMAGQAVVQAAVQEVTDTLKIALERLTRKQH